MLWTIYKTYWSLPASLENAVRVIARSPLQSKLQPKLNHVSEGQKLKTLGTIS